MDCDLQPRSTSGNVPIERYILKVTAEGYAYASDDRNCVKRVTNLPRLGSYDVLAVAGLSQGLGPAFTTRITLRDYLIVSLGDLFAAGEGSPDTRGDYNAHIPDTPAAIIGDDVTVRELVPVVWKDYAATVGEIGSRAPRENDSRIAMRTRR